MTNLTDKWKKGELPSGWYYVRLIRGEYRIDLYINGKNEWIDCPDNIIDTVVCEVPSYDEYQKLLSDQLAKNEAVEINAELEAENTKLKTENKWYSEQLNEAVKEVAKLKEDYNRMGKLLRKMEESDNAREKFQNEQIEKLKELLKECRFLLGKTPYENMSQYLTFNDVMNRIDQVLGDKTDD